MGRSVLNTLNRVFYQQQLPPLLLQPPRYKPAPRSIAARLLQDLNHVLTLRTEHDNPTLYFQTPLALLQPVGIIRLWRSYRVVACSRWQDGNNGSAPLKAYLAGSSIYGVSGL